MDERELRERLNDAASAFRFGFENSDAVVRRTRVRILRTQALATIVAVGAIVAIATAIAGRDGEVIPRPQAPVGPGPGETLPRAPDSDYVIDLNTGETTPLPRAIIRTLSKTTVDTIQYAVSPDGSQLAYVGTGDGSEEDQIFITGLDGTGVRQVTNVRNGAWSPAWSPDGMRIAYGGLSGGHVPKLFVLNVATGEPAPIADVNLDPFARLQFTPDGSSLVYTGGSNRFPLPRIVPVGGGRNTLLFDLDAGSGRALSHAMEASLSPNGSLVTFLGGEFGRPGPQRWVANADGTERRLLPYVYGITCASNPAGTWSPDGSRIVCSEGSRIIVVDIATGDASSVAVGREAIWLDDHTLLVSV